MSSRDCSEGLKRSSPTGHRTRCLQEDQSSTVARSQCASAAEKRRVSLSPHLGGEAKTDSATAG
eukprot:57914-Pyramimonas_sp.AAC.1